MKKIKMGLMALATMTGLGSAFAFNHHKAHAGTVYYAKAINSTQAKWTVNQPSSDCNASSVLDCTITSTSSNVTSLPANTYPAQFTKLGTNDMAYAQ